MIARRVVSPWCATGRALLGYGTPGAARMRSMIPGVNVTAPAPPFVYEGAGCSDDPGTGCSVPAMPMSDASDLSSSVISPFFAKKTRLFARYFAAQDQPAIFHAGPTFCMAKLNADPVSFIDLPFCFQV
jgi:hypothetical protein